MPEPPKSKPELDPMDPCADALHQLYHVLDGEHTEREVLEHFELCLPCAQALDFEAELKLLVASKCREKAPDALRQRIAEIISHESLHGPSTGIDAS